MATSQNVIQPPPFLQKWKEWLRNFENYLVAIDATRYDPPRKLALLFNHLGLAGQKVFDNLPVVPAPTSQDVQWDVYSEGKEGIPKQFSEETSVLLERHNFKRKQNSDESVKEFIAAVDILASSCEIDYSIYIYVRD